MTTVCVKWNELTQWQKDTQTKKEAAKKDAFYKSIKRDKLDFMGVDQDGYEVYMDWEAQDASTNPLVTPAAA